MKGYQLIEPDIFLTELIAKNLPDELVISIMFWMVSLLQKEEDLFEIEIDVISANYTGKYPCIGIHYLKNDSNDFQSIVLSKLDKYYLSLNFSDYYYFLNQNSEILKSKIDTYKLTIH